MRKPLALVLVLALLLALVPAPALAVGLCSVYRVWSTGDSLTAADLNTSFTTVGVTNAIPTCIDDYSPDVTTMQSTTDPYPSSVESLATSLAGELQRLRYVIKKVTGWSQWYAHTEALTVLAKGAKWGLTLSNNAGDATNDIDIAAGQAIDSTSVAVMVLASAYTKQTDAAWAVGTAAGCLDTGAVGNNTYHFFLIKRIDTNVVDVLCSLSATAPTMPTSYTLKRRIGSIVRAGGAIRAFKQVGYDFIWDVPVNDLNASANPGTAAITQTLSVPTGLVIKPVIAFKIDAQSSGTIHALLTTLTQTDTAPSVTVYTVAAQNNAAGTAPTASIVAHPFTNTSAQIRWRINSSGANDKISITVLGWTDTMDRDQ